MKTGNAAFNLILDDLLDVVVERLAKRLAVARDVQAPLVFTTHKDGPHIPGKSRRWMLEQIKAMPGARKVGRDWQILAKDYEAWAMAEDERRCRSMNRARREGPVKVQAPEPEDDLAKRAARSLDVQGFRRTRG